MARLDYRNDCCRSLGSVLPLLSCLARQHDDAVDLERIEQRCHRVARQRKGLPRRKRCSQAPRHARSDDSEPVHAQVLDRHEPLVPPAKGAVDGENRLAPASLGELNRSRSR